MGSSQKTGCFLVNKIKNPNIKGTKMKLSKSDVIVVNSQ